MQPNVWLKAARTTVPVNVLEEFDVVSVHYAALGYHHSCAMVEGEKVVCWGSDGFGQMDDESPGVSHRSGR